MLNEIAQEQKTINGVEKIKEAFNMAENYFKSVKYEGQIKNALQFNLLAKKLNKINDAITNNLKDFKRLTSRTYKAERETSILIKELNKNGVDTTELETSEALILTKHAKAIKYLEALSINVEDLANEFQVFRKGSVAGSKGPYNVPQNSNVFNGFLTDLHFNSANMDAIIEEEEKAYKSLKGAIALIKNSTP